MMLASYSDFLMCNLGVMHMAFNGSYKQQQLIMSKSLADTKDSVVLWLIFIYFFSSIHLQHN